MDTGMMFLFKDRNLNLIDAPYLRDIWAHILSTAFLDKSSRCYAVRVDFNEVTITLDPSKIQDDYDQGSRGFFIVRCCILADEKDDKNPDAVWRQGRKDLKLSMRREMEARKSMIADDIVRSIRRDQYRNVGMTGELTFHSAPQALTERSDKEMLDLCVNLPRPELLLYGAVALGGWIRFYRWEPVIEDMVSLIVGDPAFRVKEQCCTIERVFDHISLNDIVQDSEDSDDDDDAAEERP